MSSGSSVPPGALVDGANPSRNGSDVDAAMRALPPDSGFGAGVETGVVGTAGLAVLPPGDDAVAVLGGASERSRASGLPVCGSFGFVIVGSAERGPASLACASPSEPFRRARPVPVIRSKSEGLPGGGTSSPSVRWVVGAGAGQSMDGFVFTGRSTAGIAFLAGIPASGKVRRAVGPSVFGSTAVTVARATTPPAGLAATALCSCRARGSVGAGV